MACAPIGVSMTLQTSLAKLGTISDVRTWRQIEESDPDMAATLKEIVQNGGDAGAVYKFMLDHTGKVELARWCAAMMRGLLVELRRAG